MTDTETGISRAIDMRFVEHRIRERISSYKERLKNSRVLLNLYIANEEWFQVQNESMTINADEHVIEELRALLDEDD